MKTETITDTGTAAPAATAKPPQRTATITLTANGSVMSIVAERKGEAARTYVITTDAAKSQRGMTEHHATFEAAKTAIATRATQAEKLGWTRPTARRGFVAKPDAFSNLPAAPKVVNLSPRGKK